ncbi:hypothetical protein MBM_08029 [Drepanopeziza brunnea f. sp. 'multigermtubi' MB_m1]|uniref:Uncharacterized protein n=1 Tax=Marssonina brunnea f. sp. multigermtubi (strain MB_m1) TaxID=1072389 RepID=K1WYW6_MARBU|nr:uncharacterized protein MBM_08029 [Drepanopeziza brunnea f. sp. 'multigermtubi' MB_m1]EKD13828.1 hypothetical protein MBM_08029 [Drepanopeziza brunnea f. sp. 'multigermtubi' MB_m1]
MFKGHDEDADAMVTDCYGYGRYAQFLLVWPMVEIRKKLRPDPAGFDSARLRGRSSGPWGRKREAGALQGQARWSGAELGVVPLTVPAETCMINANANASARSKSIYGGTAVKCRNPRRPTATFSNLVGLGSDEVLPNSALSDHVIAQGPRGRLILSELCPGKKAWVKDSSRRNFLKRRVSTELQLAGKALSIDKRNEVGLPKRRKEAEWKAAWKAEACPSRDPRTCNQARPSQAVVLMSGFQVPTGLRADGDRTAACALPGMPSSGPIALQFCFPSHSKEGQPATVNCAFQKPVPNERSQGQIQHAISARVTFSVTKDYYYYYLLWISTEIQRSSVVSPVDPRLLCLTHLGNNVIAKQPNLKDLQFDRTQLG